MRSILSLIFCLAIFQGTFGQTGYLYLTEEEMQLATATPELADEKIRELEKLADSTRSISKKVSMLQTIVLLEPHSKGVNCELGQAYAQISELLMQLTAAEEGILMTHRALQLTRNCDRSTSATIYNHLGRLGSFHMLSENLDSALYYFRWAERFSDTVSNPIWNASAWNNLGMVWTELGHKDSAFSYYNRAIFGLNAAEPEHQHLMGSIIDNLAHWHLADGNYKVALQLFDENVERYRTFHDTMHEVKSLLGQAEVLLALKSYGQAAASLDSTRLWLGPSSTPRIKKGEQKVSYYKLRRNLCKGLGDVSCQLALLDSVMVWQQRNHDFSEKTQRTMIGALIQAEFARFNTEMSLRARLVAAYKESSDRLRTLKWIIGISVFVMLLLILQIMRKRTRKV